MKIQERGYQFLLYNQFIQSLYLITDHCFNSLRGLQCVNFEAGGKRVTFFDRCTVSFFRSVLSRWVRTHHDAFL